MVHQQELGKLAEPQQYARGRLSGPHLHEMPVCMLIGGQRSLPNQLRVEQLCDQDVGTARHVTV